MATVKGLTEKTNIMSTFKQDKERDLGNSSL